MTKTRLMIVLLFVVAFGAGICTAIVLHPLERPRFHGPSWLIAELGLNAQQQREMLKIWGDLGRNNPQKEGDKRRAFQKQRDDALRRLVPADRQAEFAKINEIYAHQMAELADQRRQAFEDAVAKTKAILTPEQRKKYEEILAAHHGGHRPPGGPENPGLPGPPPGPVPQTNPHPTP